MKDNTPDRPNIDEHPHAIATVAYRHLQLSGGSRMATINTSTSFISGHGSAGATSATNGTAKLSWSANLNAYYVIVIIRVGRQGRLGKDLLSRRKRAGSYTIDRAQAQDPDVVEIVVISYFTFTYVPSIHPSHWLRISRPISIGPPGSQPITATFDTITRR